MRLKFTGEFMCHDNEEWCKIWTGIDWSVQNWHEEFDEFWPGHLKISKICTLLGCFWPKQIFVHRLKNGDFILESKMVELNKNKNSKQPDWPDAVWKLYFTLEINE